MIETDEELKKTFKNFVAKFKRFEDWVFIEWRNANGSSNCRIRYIINEKEGELHISGDLGSGVFYWYSKNTWQDIARYANNFSYFNSKAEAKSDYGMTDWDVAKDDLRDFIQEYVEDEALKEIGYTEDEFIEEAMEGWDVYGDGTFTRDGLADEDVINFLLDNEFYSAGKVASNRERLWAIGLQMILEKYGDEGVHANER